MRILRRSDAQDIFRAIDSQREYLGKWLPFVEQTRTADDSAAFVESTLEVPEEIREKVFVIRLNGCFAGLIGFRDTDRLNRKTEIGYWLSENCQGQGIVTQSVARLCGYAFEELGMNRIQICCAVGNVPSRNVPLRLGFTFERIEREGEMIGNGIFRDLEVYSLLKEEWTGEIQ